MKRNGLLGLLAIVIVMLFSIYGLGALAFNRTKVTDQEVVISRIGIVPFSKTEYAVNLETGDEKIKIYGPSGFIQPWAIKYDGKRQCITSVNKFGSYYVSLYYEGTVYYSTGETVQKIIPYENARAYFEEGMEVRNMVRERYADILSQAQESH